MCPDKYLPGFWQTVQCFCAGDLMRKMVLAVVAMGVVMTPGLAWADAREDVVGNIARCAHLTDDHQWLDCYYGAAQPMRAWLGLSPAPQSQLKLLSDQPRSSVPPATAPRAIVASGPPPMPKKSGIFDVFGGDYVVRHAGVRSYDVARDGFTVTLVDGQVWQQTPDDAQNHPVRWDRPASSMRLSISQGAMHSFNLVVDDENVHHKVKRVR